MRNLMIILALFTVLFAAPAHAAGVLGTNNLGFKFGLLKPGDEDIKAIDSAVLVTIIDGAMKVNESVDLTMQLAVNETDGMSGGSDYEAIASELNVGVTSMFMEESSLKPFIRASVGLVESEVVYGGVTDSESRFVLRLDGGFEYIVAERLSLMPYLTLKAVDEDDYNIAGMDINHWLSKSIYLRGTLEYGFDESDFSYLLGMGFSL